MKLTLALILALTAPAFAKDAHFWTREQRFTAVAMAAEVSIDGYTTQAIRGYGGRELDPIAAPMVHRGTAGQVVASTLGVASLLATQYLLHKAGHPRRAKWAGRAALMGEGLNCARQIQVLKEWKR